MNSLRALLKKNQKVVLILVVVGILFSIYNTFIKTPPVDESVTGESRSIVNLEVGRDIINTLNQLKAINIDPEIFKDPIFLNLNDFSRPLPKQPVGKTNPFILQDTAQVTDETPTEPQNQIQ